VRPFGHPVGVDPSRFQPIAPYESDPTRWRKLPWIDRYSGQRYQVATSDERDDPEVMRLQTYRDVVRAFRTHPEAKSAGADGTACDRRTVGLLRRRVVEETYVAHIGKEANKFEEVEAGLEHDPDEVWAEYRHLDRNAWITVTVPRLRRANLVELSRKCGLSVRQLRAVARGNAVPHATNRERLLVALSR
jgi:hypothetical protein